MHDIAAVDMFVVVTARFQLLYALIVLGHERRAIIHFDVTQNPTQVWLARRMTEAFPWDAAPHFLLRDPDASYGQTFRDRVQAMAIEQVFTAPRSPDRKPMLNASLARSAANVSITSSSSMSNTCAVCCRHTLSTTSEAARISGSAKIAPSPVPCNRSLLVLWSPSQRSAACTIATSVARPELFPVTEPTAVAVPGVVAVRYYVARRQARSEPMQGDRFARERRSIRFDGQKL
jgi:hypothetical protein